MCIFGERNIFKFELQKLQENHQGLTNHICQCALMKLLLVIRRYERKKN